MCRFSACHVETSRLRTDGWVHLIGQWDRVSSDVVAMRRSPCPRRAGWITRSVAIAVDDSPAVQVVW